MNHHPTGLPSLPPDSGRRRCLRASLGAGALLASPVSALGETLKTSALVWQQRILIGFGTTLWLRAAHPEKPHLTRALDAAVSAIRHIERQLSLFDAQSAVSQLNRSGFLSQPDPDLVAALQLAQKVSQRSAGLFDVTVQPLWQLWAKARTRQQLPSPQALRRAGEAANWQGLEVSPDQIRFGAPGMAITLNGIAQGYAADIARQVLQSFDIEHALLDTGEWSPLGNSPQAIPWRLGLQNPAATNSLITTVVSDGRSIATSSDAHYVFTADRLNHHILNPVTGRSPTEIASVSVAAESCALADALTKVMFMGSIDQAIHLAGRWGVDVLAVGKDGQWQASENMPLASPPA